VRNSYVSKVAYLCDDLFVLARIVEMDLEGAQKFAPHISKFSSFELCLFKYFPVVFEY
jgi:hypothetical protein